MARKQTAVHGGKSQMVLEARHDLNSHTASLPGEDRRVKNNARTDSVSAFPEASDRVKRQ